MNTLGQAANQKQQAQPAGSNTQAYQNPFDLASQSQSFAEKTNPQALLNVFSGSEAAARDFTPSTNRYGKR